MQVKVYEAQDMRSAIEKVKRELGSEALILSSRNIYKSKLGVLGKPWIEVIAAVDSSMEAQKEKPQSHHIPLKNGAVTQKCQKPIEQDSTCTKKDHFKNILQKTEQAPLDYSRPAKEEPLLDELRQIKQSFQGLAQEIGEIKGQWMKQPFYSHLAYNGQEFAAAETEKGFLPELQGSGLGPDILKQLSGMIQKKNGSINSKNRHHLLEQAISEIVKIDNPLTVPWNGQKRISFIGPTGVGKTTTIAKVAANFLLTSNKNVALATIDNYRIAAAEQLKIYGQIMNVPVETAKSPQQLINIFNRHQDKDLILVDTAGRSPKDELSLKELAEFLDPALEIENHLVLSATTRESDLVNVVQRFQNLELRGLVFTKLDESDFLGPILNIHLRAGYPVSFLTNGQKVPEDILPPEPCQLARMILQRNRTL